MKFNYEIWISTSKWKVFLNLVLFSMHGGWFYLLAIGVRFKIGTSLFLSCELSVLYATNIEEREADENKNFFILSVLTVQGEQSIDNIESKIKSNYKLAILNGILMWWMTKNTKLLVYPP